MAEAVTGIGGIFFRAQDPKGLAEWYAKHLGITDVHQAKGPWMQAAGPTVFSAFPAETDYFPTDKQVMFNFRVSDMEKMIAQLEAAGIEVETRPDEWDTMGIGRFARIHDPEGNPIELWEPR